MDPRSIEDELRDRMTPEGASADRRRRRTTLSVVFAGLMLVVAAGFVAFRFRERQLSGVTARSARLSFEKDDGGSLASIDRLASPELWYRVTLAQAPVGRTLRLDCNWTSPSGEVSHENEYETKTITTPVWETHCRAKFGPASIPGSWFVEMTLDGRELARTPFEVR